MKLLNNYLLEDDVFFDHVNKLYNLQIPLNISKLDISPYVYLVNETDVISEKMLFRFFNYYLGLLRVNNSNNTEYNTITKFDDIDSDFKRLCFIYLVQYYFL